MMRRLPRAVRGALGALALGGLCACPPADSTVLIDLVDMTGPSGIGRDASAWLWVVEAVPDDPDPLDVFMQTLEEDLASHPGEPSTLTLDDMQVAHAAVTVDTGERKVTVRGRIPMSCAGGACERDLTVAPGTYRLYLEVQTRDRCGVTSTIGMWSEGEAVDLSPVPPSHTPAFTVPHFGFDDDNDGIDNAFELLTCGLFQHDERDSAISICAFPDDPCCAAHSDLVEPGAALLIPAVSDYTPLAAPQGAPVEVQPFYLDSTEVTWRQYARCVAAGACLAPLDVDISANRASTRQALREALDEATSTLPSPDVSKVSALHPVTGIHPDDASDYCRWAGKRLPTDLEWERAAARRLNGELSTHPFDAEEARTIGGVSAQGPLTCELSDDGRLAANVRIVGEDCLGAPAPVGSFPSSALYRYGQAPALFDLAGNVFEWTVGGAGEVFLRGADHQTERYYARTDVRVPVDPNAENVAELVGRAGFRCAVSVDELPAIYAVVDGVARVPAPDVCVDDG